MVGSKAYSECFTGLIKPKRMNQASHKNKEKTSSFCHQHTLQPLTHKVCSSEIREDASGKHLFSLGESATADREGKEEEKHGDAESLGEEETGEKVAVMEAKGWSIGLWFVNNSCYY